MMDAAIEDGDEDELLAEVGDCVRSLVPLLEGAHRDILMLVELEGVGVADAARALNITVAQARVRLHRARKALRELLTLACAACPHADCNDCRCEGCAASMRGHHACG